MWQGAHRHTRGKMKGICRSYMMAWLLAVATIVEADAQTDTYPSKPVQIIANSSAGSTPDVAFGSSRWADPGLEATGLGEQPSGCRRQPRGPPGSGSRP